MKVIQKLRLVRKNRKAKRSAAINKRSSAASESSSSTEVPSNDEVTRYFDCKEDEVAQDPQDPRFTLTDWERESVIRLKQACDDKRIHYNSLFDLAKYVLIARSSCKDSDPQADQKRMKNALNRLEKRQALLAKYNLDEVDFDEALEKMVADVPFHFINEYTRDKDDRWVVAHRPGASKWLHESNKNVSYMMKVELHRFELAAANLEEARKGIAMVVRWGDEGFTIRSCLDYIKAYLRTQDFILPCHSHRHKRIYVQIAPGAARYVNVVKRLLPSKIAERLVAVPTVNELEESLDKIAEGSEKTIYEWFAERQEMYDMTQERLHLDKPQVTTTETKQRGQETTNAAAEKIPEIQPTEEIPDIAPSGGTPFTKLFGFCTSKQED